ncbi:MULTISPECIES: hypothetical protein [unclassified Nocardioides]|uniref:hypothetical protein n=1 Tax=unclassified Nocardioides TaxID=2615069 RepID=UPI0009EFFAAB|nr:MULTISPECIES: hypothetical protein [unclassified Nocardioides]GAW47738.1 uncharacterized protein PD653B2_0045 [Nocardioides sp. PD653-B2]GAW56216.1 uncharacterized protein PD653_3652 [Nocardioides sp. PD653]
MHLLTVLPDLLPLVTSLVDDVPEDEDVKAGWVAFAIFIGLVLAVAFLGFSLVKQLRKAEAAEEAGLYDPSAKKKAPLPPVESDDPADNSAG